MYNKYFKVFYVKSVRLFQILETYYMMCLITIIINQVHKPSSRYEIGKKLDR